MTLSKPEMLPQADIIVLQGNDELAIREAVEELERRLGSSAFGSMNVSRLDGAAVTRAEIACELNMLPLDLSRRLVVLDNALECARGKDGREWLTQVLNCMPASTQVVLIIADTKRYTGGHLQWESVGEEHWLRRALRDSRRETAWLEMLLPSVREMPNWIMREAAAQGVPFEGSAAVELANLIGVDVFQARQEIGKARSYVGPNETVTRQVVRLLCSQTREEDIFALVDAVGERDGRRALGLLNALLADQPVQYIFSMVARQVRLLLMAKEISAEGGGEGELTTASGVHPFVARKLLDQCRRFSVAELMGIYHQLDDLDEASKTGKASLDVGLETLVAQLSARADRRKWNSEV